MGCSRTRKEFIRLQSMWLLVQNLKLEIVIQLSNCSERTLLRWVEKFNKGGIDELLDKPSKAGRPRKLSSKGVKDKIISILEELKERERIDYTAVRLHGKLIEEKLVEISYRTLVRYLHEEGLGLKVPRSFPEPKDPKKWQKEREEFVEELKEKLLDKRYRIWFCDESGFEADPRPRRRWAKKGEKITSPYVGRHIRESVIGNVCVDNGEFFAMSFNGVDTEVFQKYLDEMAREVPVMKGKKDLIILDNARWHKSKSLNWHHFKPWYQPAYSPDLNGIERLWQSIKREFFILTPLKKMQVEV